MLSCLLSVHPLHLAEQTGSPVCAERLNERVVNEQIPFMTCYYRLIQARRRACRRMRGTPCQKGSLMTLP